MKNLSIILLAAVLLWCSLGKTGLLISFKANESYIAKVLCENKAKPEMKCNGKCHLKKQMQAQQEQENNTPVSFEKIIDTYWIAENTTSKDNLFPSTITNSATIPTFKNSIVEISFFHPPAYC